jgi:hypothetical protein
MSEHIEVLRALLDGKPYTSPDGVAAPVRPVAITHVAQAWLHDGIPPDRVAELLGLPFVGLVQAVDAMPTTVDQPGDMEAESEEPLGPPNDEAQPMQLVTGPDLFALIGQGVRLMPVIAESLYAHFEEGRRLRPFDIDLLLQLSHLIQNGAGIPRLFDELVQDAVKQVGPHRVLSALYAAKHVFFCKEQQDAGTPQSGVAADRDGGARRARAVSR